MEVTVMAEPKSKDRKDEEKAAKGEAAEEKAAKKRDAAAEREREREREAAQADAEADGAATRDEAMAETDAYGNEMRTGQPMAQPHQFNEPGSQPFQGQDPLHQGGSRTGTTREEDLAATEHERSYRRSMAESEDELPLEERSDEAVVNRWRDFYHRGVRAGDTESPESLEAQNVHNEMERRGLLSRGV